MMTREEALLRDALQKLLEFSAPSSFVYDGNQVNARFSDHRWKKLEEARKQATLALQGWTPEQDKLQQLNDEIKTLVQKRDQLEGEAGEAERRLLRIMQGED